MKISRLVIQALFLLGLGLGLKAHAQTDTVTYVYTDPQGTPLAEADAQGNIIARYDYTPTATRWCRWAAHRTGRATRGM
jgi:hypothetical protein